MIDFHSALVYFDCTHCDGNPGQFPGGFCESCCNTGEWPFYIGTLLDNLAVAGALCAAWHLGHDAGHDDARSIDDGEPPSTWRPNTSAQPAPGWGRP